MALPAYLAPIVARYNALPRQQQLGILFGIPLSICGFFSYMSWNVLNELGPDQAIPEILRRPSGIWSEITSVDELIATQETIIAEMPKIRQRIAELQEEIAAAEERLPREAEKSAMRETFERLARDIPSDVGAVQIKSIRINEGAGSQGGAKSDYATVVYSADMVGDMNGLISYVDAIEKFPRFMTVNQISFRAGDVGIDSKSTKIRYSQHTFKLDIMTYIYSGAAKKGAKP